jgi:hypothetical protein
MEESTEHNPVSEEQLPEVVTQSVTRAELQRAHTRVAVRLGDVACSDRDTILDGPQPS